MKRIIIGVVVIIVFSLVYFVLGDKDTPKDVYAKEKSTDKMVSNMEEKISDNSVWVATLQLVWNEFKDKYVGKEISFFEGNSKEVDTLNRATFKKDEISENSYYITSGDTTPELKKQIEDTIKEKFNEKSDILDDFDWTNKESLIIYSILIKNLEFKEIFEKLEQGNFKETKNINYFGIKKEQFKLKDQVKILYYKDAENFAVKLLTKTNDEIILEKGSKKETFKDIYEEIINKTDMVDFGDDDFLRIPYLTISLKQEFPQFSGKPFYGKDNQEYIIEKTLQTLKFKLDEAGVKVKSEAGMQVNQISINMDIKDLSFDSDFTLFMKEKDKLPYLALRVNDIKDYQ